MTATAPVATEPVGARVEPKLRRQLVEIAARNERSVSQEVRRALRRHIAHELHVSDAVREATAA